MNKPAQPEPLVYIDDNAPLWQALGRLPQSFGWRVELFGIVPYPESDNEDIYGLGIGDEQITGEIDLSEVTVKFIVVRPCVECPPALSPTW
jgi:hypothetical protein